MASSQNNSDDEEFDIETNTITDIETAQQRLKEFSYYLVENIEYNLNFCLQLLEERPVPAKATSLHITALSVLCSAIPHLPGGVGNALKTGESTIFRKIEKKNSRILADLVYYFSDNKEKFRNTVIEAAIEVFSSFETQFLKLTCNGGEKRSMQKLAIDASDRIFNYFLITEQNREVTKAEVIKGIVYGDSKRNKKGIKEGKQVLNEKVKWKTCKLYSKVGIVIIDSGKTLFYKTDDVKPKKYGYRKIFSWENQDEIMKTWILDNYFEFPIFYLEITDELKRIVNDYIMTKNMSEDAKLDRRKYNEEANIDREDKHSEILNILKDRFKEIYDGMNTLLENITTNNEKTNTLLVSVVKNQEEDNKKQEVIITKLDEVHIDVKETKETQQILVQTTETIQSDIVCIKNTQDEISVAVVTHDEIENILKTQGKDNAKEGIKELVDEALVNADLSKKLKDELERFKPRVERELQRSGEKIKNFFSF